MKKYLVDLTADERAALQAVVRRGKTSARKVSRARIPLQAARGATDAQMVSAGGVGSAKVERTRLSDEAEARLMTEVCSQDTEGREY
jgi:hypothetical protein